MTFARQVLSALLLFSPGNAAPEDEVIVAAMRLSEEPSYRWATTVIDNARGYTVEGRVLENGYSWVRLPLVEPIALRMPWKNDDVVEAVFRGPDRCAVLTPDGWKTLRELPRKHHDWADDNQRPYIPMRNVGNLLTREGQRPYSNAQFALSPPHQELAIIVSSCHELKVDGAEASGLLSNIGAQLLLVADGQEHLRPVIAAGRFKLWLDEGRVAKYEIELEGVLLVNGQECLVRQTSTTAVHDVGSTSFEVPAVVRRMLE